MSSGWETVDGKLRRRFAFADFSGAMGFAVRVGLLAERVDHHPELTVRWGEVVVTVWSHDVGTISERDRDFAARCDALVE